MQETNRIDLFQRVPSDLRRYLEYNAKIKKEYGSVMEFVLKERLQWMDLKPKSKVLFREPGRPRLIDRPGSLLETHLCFPGDTKILYNDWPYGIDKKIVHLVVWMKLDLEDDPATDDLTAQARKQIDGYVAQTFCRRVPAEHVSNAFGTVTILAHHS